MTPKKKLIEVALPLEAINKASAKEKSIRHGHPSTLHLWWARRPLAAARAVIFAQMVDDPSEHTATLLSDPGKKRAATRELAKRRADWTERKAKHAEASRAGNPSAPIPGPEPTLEECVADIERERLFRIIEELVLWENTTNEKVLQQARDEIWQSWRYTCAENADHPRAKELFDQNKLPAFHDPFAGGGTLPLEAQRLGLESYASDLNPVAVMLNKAMIEIPPRFSGKPSVNPSSRDEKMLLARDWRGAQNLAEDVRYYGQWIHDEAERRIGHLYPKVEVTAEMALERQDLKALVGQKLTVIAWLWARTVKSPNPAFAQVDVPLASTFMLCTKEGKEAYVEAVVTSGGYRLTVKMGKPKNAAVAESGTKLARANFACLMSGAPIPGDYIKAEAKAGRMGARLMAIVVEGERKRVYLPPTEAMEAVARQASPKWKPEVEFFQQALGFRIGNYGMTKWSDLFTPRQLVALTTFSDLIHETRERVKRDAVAGGFSKEETSLVMGGTGAAAYSDAVAVYLSFCVDKASLTNTTQALWQKDPDRLTQAFGRQAIPMTWDYAEANPTSEAGGGFGITAHAVAKVLERLPSMVSPGSAEQCDAATQSVSELKVISTDPPYYDNVGYADLSDFFYVWLRQSLRPAFPDLFSTLAVPKDEELVATPDRHGGRDKAEAFFLNGMTQAMHRLAEQAHPAFPVTIYYAFRQAETDNHEGTASTGWDTFLDAVIRAGFSISGTWPMRTEYTSNLKTKRNALASSIVLVCRKRAADASTATRREFMTSLKAELPLALSHLQRGNIAPVDLAQTAIGPGMAVYTRYATVLDAAGKPLSVREALALINQTLDEALAEQEGDFDSDSRWALAWFEQSGFAEGDYGVAETLSKAKNTSVAGMVEAGILTSSRSKVRLLKPSELPNEWDPTTDARLTAWEMVHHLIRVLEASGENGAAVLAGKLGTKAETARELCYRLYAVCERKKRAGEALSYNGLVQSWPEITRLAREQGKPRAAQTTMFEKE